MLGLFVLLSCNIFSPPDSNGCDHDSLTKEERANCGTHLYRTNAEIFGDNCYFGEDQKTISEEVEYTFIFTEEEGFIPLWDFNTWMYISTNSYTMTDADGINTYYSAYEFREGGFLKQQRDDNNCLILFENILLSQ